MLRGCIHHLRIITSPRLLRNDGAHIPVVISGQHRPAGEITRQFAQFEHVMRAALRHSLQVAHVKRLVDHQTAGPHPRPDRREQAPIQKPEDDTPDRKRKTAGQNDPGPRR